uniref:Uncharacterized protein n=1 Tax=Triticum urartu TaxID=4572 RepID=A0A8R7P5D4_TRIUA
MVKSKSSLGPDGEYEHTVAESNFSVGETTSSFGAGGSTLQVAMWRLQKSLEERSAAQERQTARKRRMDLTGRRSSTSNIMSSGSNRAQRARRAFFLLLLGNASAVIFPASPQDGVALFLLLPPIISPPTSVE